MTPALIIVPAFLAIIGGLIVGFYVKNRNKDPKEPEEPEDPEKPEEPEDEPEDPDKPEDDPDKPDDKPDDEPDKPDEPEEPEDKKCLDFQALILYFSQEVNIEQDGPLYKYLFERYQMAWDCYSNNGCNLYVKDNFPTVINYFTESVDYINKEVTDQMLAWLFGMILAELVPEKRDILYQMAYDYQVKGAEQPTYGYTFMTDPNVARMIAASAYAITRDASKIADLRKEVGGKKIKYEDDIEECFIDLTKFMPHAAGPYIGSRKAYPVDVNEDIEYNLDNDKATHDYISQYYSLDTKDAEKRQRTIQAIADKDSHEPHLFGGDRTVEDPDYGVMTFHPVFGKHNIGIEIPANGVIATLVRQMGEYCSQNRKTLLDQEYGRRRPGQGKRDESKNADPAQRVLVNYAIEEGDGHTTGYYNKDGDYIDYDGDNIGDYVTYFQKELWSNSYPSGHSAFIFGVAMLLMEIMPDRASLILKAANDFALSRNIARYHWVSDTIHGRVIGSTFIPILHSISNFNLDKMIEKAKKEYQDILGE